MMAIASCRGGWEVQQFELRRNEEDPALQKCRRTPRRRGQLSAQPSTGNKLALFGRFVLCVWEQKGAEYGWDIANYGESGTS